MTFLFFLFVSFVPLHLRDILCTHVPQGFLLCSYLPIFCSDLRWSIGFNYRILLIYSLLNKQYDASRILGGMYFSREIASHFSTLMDFLTKILNFTRIVFQIFKFLKYIIINIYIYIYQFSSDQTTTN